MSCDMNTANAIKMKAHLPMDFKQSLCFTYSDFTVLKRGLLLLVKKNSILYAGMQSMICNIFSFKSCQEKK